MNILIINKFLYENGGSETYIFELGRQLQKMGHKVEFFGMKHPQNIVGNHAGSYTENMDFHSNRRQKLLYPFKVIYSFEARKQLKKVLRDFEPDIVHLNNFNYQLTPSILYEIKRFAIPIIYTAHDVQLVCPNHLMVNGRTKKVCDLCGRKSVVNCIANKCIHHSLLKSTLGTVENLVYKMFKTYRLLDVIICPSYFIEGKINYHKQLIGKTVVMRNFVKKNADSKKVTSKQKYVLYFGRYSEEKGIHTLLAVCKKKPQIPFVFVGKGELETEISKIENVKNLGFLSGEKLNEIIENAAFCIYPSECYENCPFSIMEAQMLGTPVIGADIGGIPELIQTGQTGELFESGNAKELGDKIQKLWDNQSQCLIYSKNCKEIEYDSCQEYCQKLVEIYQNELKEKERKNE